MIGAHAWRQLGRIRQCVTRLQRRNYTLGAGQGMKSIQCLVIGHRNIFRPSAIFEPGVFRPDSRVVQTGGYRVCLADLTNFVLNQVGSIDMQHTRQIGTEES